MLKILFQIFLACLVLVVVFMKGTNSDSYDCIPINEPMACLTIKLAKIFNRLLDLNKDIENYKYSDFKKRTNGIFNDPQLDSNCITQTKKPNFINAGELTQIFQESEGFFLKVDRNAVGSSVFSTLQTPLENFARMCQGGEIDGTSANKFLLVPFAKSLARILHFTYAINTNDNNHDIIDDMIRNNQDLRDQVINICPTIQNKRKIFEKSPKPKVSKDQIQIQVQTTKPKYSNSRSTVREFQFQSPTPVEQSVFKVQSPKFPSMGMNFPFGFNF